MTRAPERLELPRTGVLLVATMIIAIPGAFALAGHNNKLRHDANGELHRHVGKYRVWNGVSGDTQLQSRVTLARQDWTTKLSANGAQLEVAPAPGGGIEDTDVLVRRENLNNDTNAAIVWAAGYHPKNVSDPPVPPGGTPREVTNVVFDSDRTQSWSGDEKQGKTCKVLGHIIGLETAGNTRQDCMEDPIAHQYVKPASIGLVDEFYGPNVHAPTGSMYDDRNQLLFEKNYTFDVEADGHALASVSVRLDGQQVAQATPQPACVNNCEIAASFSRAGSTLGSGAHTVEVVATNEFGQTEAKTYALTVETPVFFDGFDGPAGPVDASKWQQNAVQYLGPDAGTGVRSCWYTGAGTNYVHLDGSAGGNLVLRAENTTSPPCPNSTRPYTTGAVTTNLQGPGRSPILFHKGQEIEARIKVPGGTGVWPAFWLKDLENDQKTEIDIFEYWGNSSEWVWGSLHDQSVTNPNPNQYSDGFASRGLSWDTGSDVSGGYHTYGVSWDDDQIAFTFDDEPYDPNGTAGGTRPPIEIADFTGRPSAGIDDDRGLDNGDWEFDTEQLYLVINLAVGDNNQCNNQPVWPGGSCGPSAPPGPPPAVFPAEMKVDWVKVWD